MNTSHDNQETRYRCALAVTLRRKAADVELLTTHVGASGAFLRCEASPPTHSLVRLAFTLPEVADRLEVSACASAIVTPAEATDRYPGFDARFVGLSGSPKERWDALLRRLRREQPEGKGATLVLARPSYVDRFQRRGLIALDAPLRPATSQDLRELVEGQVLGGALFVPTEVAIVVGATLNVQLLHPITGDVFPLEGVVKRRVTAPLPGVHVALTGLTDEIRGGLQEFVDSVLVVADYDVELLEPPVLRARGT